MLIVSEETKEYTVLDYIPRRIKKYLYNLNLDDVEEIRLRRNMPVTVKTSSGRFVLTKKGELSCLNINPVICDDFSIEQTLMSVCENSFYSYCDKMVKGYVTLEGGHRVGIAGSFSQGEDKRFLSEVSGLNFRVAREMYGISDDVADKICTGSEVKNTLIISPPGCGKTTLLRDLVRNLSCRGMGVCVVDERHELFAMHNGIPSFDTGSFTDILDNCSKADGMEMALRSLSPQVIVTDEIGSEEINIIKYILKCGVNIIATAHGDLQNHNKSLAELFEKRIYIDYDHSIYTEGEKKC